MEKVTGRFLYFTNFYDFPREGVMLSPEFGRLWFEVDDDSRDADSPYLPWFLVFELTDAEWARENDRQACFRHYVGTHHEYEEDGRGGPGRRSDPLGLRPTSDWMHYYRRYPSSRTEYPETRAPFGIWDPYGPPDQEGI